MVQNKKNILKNYQSKKNEIIQEFRTKIKNKKKEIQIYYSLIKSVNDNNNRK